MTAKKQAAPAPTGTEVATRNNSSLPAGIGADQLEFLASRANQGFEGVKMSDLVMPRVNILQSLSPQINPRKPEFVNGAKEGQIFNSATQTVTDTLDVLPCHYIRHHLEWKPNRGGLVADHGEAGEALLSECKRNEQNYDVLPNGNLLVPTGTWYCIDLATGRQIIIPMSRTQLRPSRQWMSMATSETIKPWEHDPNDTRPEFTPPLFFRSYRLGSVLKQDDQNEWFVFTVERGPSIFELDRPELMAKATQFRDMLVSGEIKADAASFAEEDVAGGGNRNDAM